MREYHIKHSDELRCHCGVITQIITVLVQCVYAPSCRRAAVERGTS